MAIHATYAERAPEREPPSLNYRTGSGPAGSPDQGPSAGTASGPATMADRIVHWLTWGILGVVLLVWALVGAVFWLPLLLRTMVRFSLSLVQSTMDAERPDASARTLRQAVDFYRRGFVLAIDAVMGQDEPGRKGRTRRDQLDPDRMKREVMWALVIWYPILWWVGLAWSPVELWAWIAGLPWGETLDAIAGWIAGAIEGLIGPAGGPPVEAPPVPESSGAVGA